MDRASRPNVCPPPQEHLCAIADALGDTSNGLTGSEIGHLLATCRIIDIDPALTKRHRLYNAFASDQNRRQHRRNIVQFIRVAMKPEQYIREPHRFEPMRALLNRALAFAALAVDASGALEKTENQPARCQRQSEFVSFADDGSWPYPENINATAVPNGNAASIRGEGEAAQYVSRQSDHAFPFRRLLQVPKPYGWFAAVEPRNEASKGVPDDLVDRLVTPLRAAGDLGAVR